MCLNNFLCYKKSVTVISNIFMRTELNSVFNTVAFAFLLLATSHLFAASDYGNPEEELQIPALMISNAHLVPYSPEKANYIPPRTDSLKDGGYTGVSNNSALNPLAKS